MVVIDLILKSPGSIAKINFFSGVAKGSGPGAECGDSVDGVEGCRIFSDDEISVCRKNGRGGEGEFHGIGEHPAGNVDVRGTGIVEFDKFFFAGFVVRVVVDFVNDNLAGESGGRGECFGRWSPGGARCVDGTSGVVVGSVRSKAGDKTAEVS